MVVSELSQEDQSVNLPAVLRDVVVIAVFKA